MHVIVNKLTLARPFEPELLRRVETELFARAAEHPGFVDGSVVAVGATEVVLVIRFTTREALDDVSKNVAGPWFAANVRAYLAGPAERLVGEVVAYGKR